MKVRSSFFTSLDAPVFSENRIGPKMSGFVGVTDNNWFAFLSQQPGIDEVHSLAAKAKRD